MTYSGTYKIKHKSKYKGDVSNVVYRSMWEKKFMIFCDRTRSIVEWGSEEIIIPYRCPTDGKVHRYYPDFYIKVLNKDGKYKKYIIEVKPKKQVAGPDKNPKRKTAAWKRDVLTFMKNQAKWEAAEDYCDDRRMNFMILTEDHLNV